MAHWAKSWVKSLEAASGTDYQSPLRALEGEPASAAAASASSVTATAPAAKATLAASAESAPAPAKGTKKPPARGTSLPGLYAVQVVEVAVAEEQSTSSSSSSSRYLAMLSLRRQSASGAAVGKACSQATLTLDLAPEPSSTAADGPGRAAVCSIELRLEIVGYDVSKDGHFRQVLLSSCCKCAVLVSRHCLAFVGLPALSDKMKAPEDVVRAVPLMSPGGADFVKVSWHPQSDNHIGILLSDGHFQLLNLAFRSAMSRPEFSFKASGEEKVADFVFGAPGMPGLGRLGYLDLWCNPAVKGFKRLVSVYEAPWLALAVIFISTNGRITFRSPVLPSFSTQPALALQELNKDFLGAPGVSGMAALSEVREWLGGTLLSRAARHEADVPRTQAKEYVTIHHNLHELGNEEAYRRRWHPAEQFFEEEEASAKESTKNRGKYCSLTLLAQAPVPVLARATTTGTVEILMANGAIGPRFRSAVQGSADQGAEQAQHEALECTVLEEIDLANSSWQNHYVHLTTLPPREGGHGALLLAQTSLAAIVIESAWVGAVANGDAQAQATPAARITTLYDQVGCHGHVLAMQPVLLPPKNVGASSTSASPFLCTLFCLRSQYPAGSKSEPAIKNEAIDLYRKLGPPRSQAGVTSIGPGAAAEATKSSTGTKSSPDADDSKRRDLRDLHKMISGSTMLPRGPLFGQPDADGAEGLVKEMNKVHKGQLANLLSRQECCDVISKQTAAEASTAKAEMKELRRSGQELLEEARSSREQFEKLEARQEMIKRRFEALLARLSKELEARALEETASEELPRLWSQLCELRQAYEMFRAVAVGPTVAQDPSFKPGAHHLKTVEELQNAWTCTYTDRLRAQAHDVEQAVAKAVQAMHGEPHTIAP